MGRLLIDLKQAFRAIWVNPTHAVVSVVTFTVGIGGATAIFSVVYGVLMRPLPFDHPEQLVRLYERHQGASPLLPEPMLSNLTFHNWRSDKLQGLAAFRTRELPLQEPDRAVIVRTAEVSPSLFGVLRTSPAVGRLLAAEDADIGSERVAVISDALWHSRFGGAPSAVGAQLMLDGVRYRVVGVTQEAFAFPETTQVWIPYRVPNPAESGPRQALSVFSAIGRLRPEVTAAEVAAEATAAAQRIERPQVADMVFGKGGHVEVLAIPLLTETTRGVRLPLLMMTIAVTVVLIISVANVVHVALARDLGRKRDMVIRSALGGSPRTLLQQMVVERCVLALIGGSAAVGVTIFLVQAFPQVAPDTFPRKAEVAVGWTVLAFCGAVTMSAGILAGVIPCWRASHVDIESLRDGINASVGRSGRRLSRGLLTVETAMALMVLITAFALGRSFQQLVRRDLGFETNNVLLVKVNVGQGRATPVPEDLIPELLTRVRGIEDVEAVGVGNAEPLGRTAALAGFAWPGAGPDGTAAPVRAVNYVVTPGYAEALRLRLLDGRLFTEQDMVSGMRPVIVSETFAREYIRGSRPVGTRVLVQTGADANSQSPIEVVGVVADTLGAGVNPTPQPQLYWLPRNGDRFVGEFNVIVRTKGDLGLRAELIKQFLSDINRAAAIVESTPLERKRQTAQADSRFAVVVLALLALTAMTLVATGLYGVFAYDVMQRVHELRIRAALGASRTTIGAHLLRPIAFVIAAGVIGGALSAALLTTVVRALLTGLDALDVWSYVLPIVAVVLLAVGAVLLPVSKALSQTSKLSLRSM